MRLFFALPIPRDWEKTFEKYRDRHGDIPYLRWTPLANLHVTTLFLGEVDDEALDSVRRRAREVARAAAPIALALHRVQYAPLESRARMIWAYFDSDAAYVDLVLELARMMSEIPVGLDDLKSQLLSRGADIVPHATLARFRSDIPYPRELRRLSRTGREGEICSMNELILFESQKRPNHPPIYRPVDAFTLGA
jgi:2'-5' RNA ligase